MPSKYVTLLSDEGYEFVLQREAAEQSKMIRDLLSVQSSDDTTTATTEQEEEQQQTKEGGGAGAGTTVLKIHDIPAKVLDLVAQYLVEKRAAMHTMSEFKPLKMLEPSKEEDRQLVLELLLAADYLDC